MLDLLSERIMNLHSIFRLDLNAADAGNRCRSALASLQPRDSGVGIAKSQYLGPDPFRVHEGARATA